MKKYLIALLPGIVLYFLFNYTHQGEINLALRDFGRLSYFYIALSLAITPLLSLGGTQKLLPYRRAFGVLAFYTAIIHTGIYFYLEKVYSKFFFVLEHFKRLDVLTGVIGLLIIIPLGITSNNQSVNLLKSFWKKLQSLVYPLFLIVAVHVAFASRFDSFYMVMITLLVILRTAGYMKEDKSNVLETGKPRWLCVPCGYIYDEEKGDPDSGVAPGTRFEDIPDDWRCPICGVDKSMFVLIGSKEQTKERQLHEMRIEGIKMLTSDVMEFKVYSLVQFFVIPGQFAKFIFNDKDGEFARSYSIVSYIDGILTFCVRVVEGGRGGKILKAFNKGDIVKMEGVFGNFQLLDTPKDKVFIATGTGLSPVYNMALNAKNSKNKMLFGVRNLDDVFYLDELQKIKDLDLHVYCSALLEDKLPFKCGRLNLDEFEFISDTEFYICGNPGMVKDTVSKLEAKGFESIYHEQF